MDNSYIDGPMLEAFVYETSQIVEALEQMIITSEKIGSFSKEAINEIFRFMHTIKGSSASISLILDVGDFNVSNVKAKINV